MKISIFRNTYCLGIDYSRRKNCLGVFDITEEEVDFLLKKYDFEIKNGELVISKGSSAILFEKEQQIKKIIQDFDKKIQDYLSKYPKSEQEQFANKLSFAKEVIDGGFNVYISKVAEAKGVTPEVIATVIKTKAEEFEVFYTEAEIERDRAIAAL